MTEEILPIFAYFVYFISPPLILLIGLTGNTLGVIAFVNKKLSNVGPCIIYLSLFLSDTFYILQLAVFYLQSPFLIDSTVISQFSCKLFYYLNYLGSLPSPWLLVYISIEKCISIIQPKKRFILKKPLYQYTYIFIVYSFGCLFYVYVAVDFDLIQIENKTVCNYQDYSGQLIINWMYFMASVFLPFLTMILISVTLAIFISIISFQQKANPEIISEKLTKRLARDKMYTKSSFFMNFIFIVLNLPVSILIFYPNVLVGNNILYFSTNYLQFLSYGINFYIIFITNPKFRGSIWKMIRKNQPEGRENLEMT